MDEKQQSELCLALVFSLIAVFYLFKPTINHLFVIIRKRLIEFCSKSWEPHQWPIVFCVDFNWFDQIIGEVVHVNSFMRIDLFTWNMKFVRRNCCKILDKYIIKFELRSSAFSLFAYKSNLLCFFYPVISEPWFGSTNSIKYLQFRAKIVIGILIYGRQQFLSVICILLLPQVKRKGNCLLSIKIPIIMSCC